MGNGAALRRQCSRPSSTLQTPAFCSPLRDRFYETASSCGHFERDRTGLGSVIPCLTCRRGCSGREIHALNKIDEPGMLTQVIEKRLYAEKAHEPVSLLICLLQILNGPIALVKTISGNGKTKRRHVAPCGERLQ